MSSGPPTCDSIVTRTQGDMVAEAERAGLIYIDGETDGYLRREADEGFDYLEPDGTPLSSSSVISRIDDLVIPPNWHDVWICRNRKGHIQATGRDDAGRKQYIYHEGWEEHRARSRCANIIEFGRRLADFREQLDSDLRRRALGRERLCAIACAVLDRTYMRIGQEYYDREHGTHGLTTLHKDEVYIGSTRVEMNFIGKGGLERNIEFSDRRLAAQLAKVAELPGERLMQYERGDNVYHLSASQVNDYIKENMGEAFSAKDFRSWGGTVHCLEALTREDVPENSKTCQKRLVAAVKATSERLGNTPAVARNHYIHIDLLRLGEEADLWKRLMKELKDMPLDERLEESEARLMLVLEQLAA